MNRCPSCGTVYSDDARFCTKDGTRLLGPAAAPPPAAATPPRPTAVPVRGAATPIAHTNLVGQTLQGRYEIVKKVGEGGMSFVYLANDIATRERYAIKVLSAALSQDTNAMARLRREASLGMRLAHPNICHIIRLGETEDGLVYVVMPFVEGEILADRTNRLGRISLSDTARLVNDMAQGLFVAHQLKIVHRDLKPENIMVCPRPGGPDVAVVMDFGLAKERRADAELQKLTATGIILGTPEFMSPEQLRGKPLDARTDIYSLALMTYEMLTGKLPFQGRTQQEMMIARLRSDPTPLRKTRPELEFPDAVEKVLFKAMQRNPDDRYQSAPEFAEAFTAAAATAGPSPAVLGEAAEATAACSASCLDADRIVNRVRLAPFSALVAVVLCAAAPVGAQAVRPYNRSIDVVDYDLTIDLPDTGSVIRGRAVLTIKRTAPTDTLVLDLLDLGVDRVTVDGEVARFRRDPERVVISLPKGQTNMKVAVEYSGAVTDGLIVRTDSAGRWTGFGDNWPNRGRHWIPGIDHPSDKATVTWTVRGPSERTVVANGRLVSRRAYTASGKARTETKWRETRPIPVYLMVIAAAPLTMFDLGDTSCGLAELQRCVAQSVYTAPEQARLMPGPFSRAGEMVQLFSRLVGPFPYEKLAHLQSSTRFGGMENASAIFYSDNGVRRGLLGEGTVAHEIAHQWFGDAVTEREWPHVWLSEGFATYFAALWTRAARGDSAFRREMADIRRRILDDSASVTRRPVIDTIETSLLALLNRNSYEKGGFVLHMLRTEIGERAFFDGIRAYYAKHKHGTALTDDLRAEMERASGRQLGWFFDQWLRRPGYPSVQAEWAYDATTREVKVTVSQGGRFGAFQMPVAIAVTDSNGVAQRVRLALPDTDGATTTARIPLATAPASVVVDPDVVALASISVVRR